MSEIVYGLTSLSPQQAKPQRLMKLLRNYWDIEKYLHYRKDVTLREDAIRATVSHSEHNLAIFNNLVIALFLTNGCKNLARARRVFDARPDQALEIYCPSIIRTWRIALAVQISLIDEQYNIILYLPQVLILINSFTICSIYCQVSCAYAFDGYRRHPNSLWQLGVGTSSPLSFETPHTVIQGNNNSPRILTIQEKLSDVTLWSIMYKDLKVGIAIPAYNEEKLIGQVIETMPDFVDMMIVVDDRSKDRTRTIAESYLKEQGDRLVVIHHEKNTGVGGAVTTAYKYAYEKGIDVVAVMAGDAQMLPDELPAILDPIADNEADYTKGNRLSDEVVWRAMPRFRFFGNHLLSLLTKIASGYWHVNDSQAGYTALSRNAIEKLNLDKVSHGYQFENSMLVHLNIMGLRVVNVAITPVYGIGEKSTIVVWKAGIEMAWYLLSAFIERIWKKYYLRNFHPIILFYGLGVFSFLPGILLGLFLVITRLTTTNSIAITSALFAVFLTLVGMQFLLVALFMDMSTGRKTE